MRADPFHRSVPRPVRPAGLVTQATVQGLPLFLPQAKTLRRAPQWEEDGGHRLVPSAQVYLLARTPYWTGSEPGSGRPGEALWFAQTATGLRGWLRLSHEESEGMLLREYILAFPDEEGIDLRSLLSALPEDRTPLVGPPAGGGPPAPGGGRVPGYALAGLAGVLAALGLYYLSTGSDR